TPVLGVQTTAVLGALSGGGDRELDDSLREKLRNRIQKPPQGGDANDYVQWTLAAPGGGATRACVSKNRRKAGMPTTTCNGPWQHPAAVLPAPGSVVAEQFGEGTVGVAFVCDGNGAGTAVLPSTAQIAAVATYIDTVRPVTAHVTVYAPLAVPINFAIAGLSPNTLAVQQAIVAELAEPSSAMAMAQALRSFPRPHRSLPWRPTSTRFARSPHM
ncbi:baseplate J/gp47 family protein, partial [Xanthomonas sp. MUS 060]|uniref:baseplate J/gp47 family protein n=1 Tax=Xanthomonas sp. MUS 060 TaxID=1588031 RepID=UPI000AD7BD04